MFFTTFYIFSLLLSYTDCKRFIVPDIILFTMTLMLLFFGLIEEKIYLSSFIMPIIVLALFVVILLLNPKSILGGGDIKYIMVVAFYLPFLSFPIFLIITGLLQTFALLIARKLRKRKIVAMVPLIFISSAITEFISFLGINPLH